MNEIREAVREVSRACQPVSWGEGAEIDPRDAMAVLDAADTLLNRLELTTIEGLPVVRGARLQVRGALDGMQAEFGGTTKSGGQASD